ncbi:WEB family protein [Camellia lanceoleosa]|uniref:WEB family protein n=1 Tax=Camellia lanceoleosa TaxID=1840588 RepID=A0ACC0IMS7_9ERIC|nr:WEB family protein [Camellia lanceoleosa]
MESITHHHSSTVDTSRPFTSVKEAVAIFGEKLLTGELYSSSNPFSAPKQWNFSLTKAKESDDEDPKTLAETLNRLESELKETKTELKLLKERESETEVALASLNAELHKNMSKMAKAEAAAAGNAAAEAVARTGSARREEEVRKRDMIVRMEEDKPTLAQVLGIGDEEGLFGGRENGRKMMMVKKKKKKPIIPLVGDLFFRKKGSSASLRSSLFSSTHVYLN